MPRADVKSARSARARLGSKFGGRGGGCFFCSNAWLAKRANPREELSLPGFSMSRMKKGSPKSFSMKKTITASGSKSKDMAGRPQGCGHPERPGGKRGRTWAAPALSPCPGTAAACRRSRGSGRRRRAGGGARAAAKARPAGPRRRCGPRPGRRHGRRSRRRSPARA